ncbi:hypothetical protein [Rhizobium ruizarguesonis]|uniref:hypothetical protein n=1 Tax=Rhizobium ruizarguesonis TaxID=2081791 RepID=UPI0010319897|nr:hypothetical protein [Rhizobium ruizarguesonis]TAZ23397.1 hypothetical protein ELH74_37685 [Rhizobium ruizarguesonis]TBD07703.1 hypothetical protein ELH23_38965 [Rhizobium ruizarguesonis]
MGNLPFYVVGVILGLYAFYLVQSKTEVTVSHATIFAVAAVIGLFPYISSFASFELTHEGLKFTTHEQGAEIANKVETVFQRQNELIGNIQKLSVALKDANEKIEALSRPGTESSPTTGDTAPAFDPSTLDAILKNTGKTAEFNNDSIMDLRRLQKELRVPSSPQM